jgi:hypothetical protein
LGFVGRCGGGDGYCCGRHIRCFNPEYVTRRLDGEMKPEIIKFFLCLISVLWSEEYD